MIYKVYIFLGKDESGKEKHEFSFQCEIKEILEDGE
jgi:hypothetical protein